MRPPVRIRKYRLGVLLVVFVVSWLMAALTLRNTRTATCIDIEAVKTSTRLEVRPATDSQSVKVLIVAYFRSGSTFTSKILGNLNHSFYVFEPLHAIYEYLLLTHKNLTFLHGKNWSPLYEGFEGPYALDIIKALFTCNFKKVDTVTLTMGFLPRHTHQINAYVNCTRATPSSNCMGALENSCRSAPIRVIKTIRTSMKSLPEILREIPDLKVIHLIRDPRGQLASALRIRGTSRFHHYRVCNKVTDDIKIRKQLETLYPGTFHEVIYEDLVQNPMYTVKEMYRFIKLSLPEYIIDWLKEMMWSHDADEQTYLGTRRSNSTLTAYAWVKRLSWTHIMYFDRACSWLLTYGDFPFLKTENDLKNFTIPYRKQRH